MATATTATEIDSLIQELNKDFSGTKQPRSDKEDEIILTEETIEAFILKKASKIIGHGIDSIEDLKNAIQQTIVPDEILAYSDLIKSTTGALETLNRINLQKRKSKTAKEIKQLELQARKNLPFGGAGIGNMTNNFLIATREEVFKALLKDAKKASTSEDDVIEAEVERIETKEQS